LNPDDTPYALAFSTDGSTLVSGDLDGRIDVWCNVDDRMRDEDGFGDPDAVWRQHTASVRSLAFSDDGRTLFSASDDGTTLMWNLADWECGPRIPVPVQVWPLATTDQSPVRGAVWSKTQRSLVLGISNGDLRFLSFDAAKLAAELCQQVGPGKESEWDGIVSYGPLDSLAHYIGERPDPHDVCADAPRPTPTSEPESGAPP
jgi:hypothetical protein